MTAKLEMAQSVAFKTDPAMNQQQQNHRNRMDSCLRHCKTNSSTLNLAFLKHLI